MERSYQHLLSPGRIGSLALRNRIIMTPMGSNLGEGDGVFGERACAYYRERARGGAGLLILGSVSIAWPVSGVIPRQAAISEDRHIPGIRAVADAVHDCGGKLALQLHFGGLMSTMDTGAGRPLWTPSVPEKKKGGDMMDAILEEEFAAWHRRSRLQGPYGGGYHGPGQLLRCRRWTCAVRARGRGGDSCRPRLHHLGVSVAFHQSAHRRLRRFG